MLFMYVLWTHTYSNHLPLKKNWIVFLLLTQKTYSTLGTICQVYFTSIFSQSFHFLNSVFKEQTFLILTKLNLSIFFSFMVCAVVLSNLCLTIVLKEFLLCYFFFLRILQSYILHLGVCLIPFYPTFRLNSEWVLLSATENRG